MQEFLTVNQSSEGNALWNMSLALDKLGERYQAVAHAELALLERQAESTSPPQLFTH